MDIGKSDDVAYMSITDLVKKSLKVLVSSEKQLVKGRQTDPTNQEQQLNESGI